MKGIIALDIDGTLTSDIHSIPPDVISYLEHLSYEDWKICLITGRGFRLASPALRDLTFPYHLSVHNGAGILDFPGPHLVKKYDLSPGILPVMEDICEKEPTDFVIYSGFENQDLCYYRPSYFGEGLLKYLEKRTKACQEIWRPIQKHEEMLLKGFSALKCFGTVKSLQRIVKKIEKELGLDVPIIRDLFSENMYLAQVTHQSANKGVAIHDYKALFDCKGPVIAAGDETSDFSMLKAADVKIAMPTAPNMLRDLADIVAQPVEELGIIPALEQAIELVARKDNVASVY